MVGETNEAGARVTEVAAQHGRYPGLVFTWRRQVRDGMLMAAPPPTATFVPLRMLEPAQEPRVDATSPSNEVRPAPAKLTRPSEVIEITL
jgi:transposase